MTDTALKPIKAGRHDLATKARFVELRAQGVSLAKCAKTMKVGKTTLIEWGRDMEGEIRSARAVELEALHEQYFIAKEAKIKLFGQLVQRVVKELEKRNLKELSTGQLLDVLAKYHAILEGEGGPLIFKSEAEIDADRMTMTTLMRLSAGTGS